MIDDREMVKLLRRCLRAVEDLIEMGRQEYSADPTPEDLDLCIELKRTILALESRTPAAPSPARLA